IKKAFQTEGIIGGLKRLGWVLLDSLMKPFQQILELVDKVIGTNWAEKIKSVRESQGLVTDGEKSTEQKPKSYTVNGRTFIGVGANNGSYLSDLAKARAAGFTGSEGEYAAWKKEQDKKNNSISTISPDSIIGVGSGKGKKGKAGKGEKEHETSVNGNGASVKTINVRVEMKNYFNVDKSYGSADSIANQVIGKINDRLRDAIVAID
ncbi:MAG: hypothetical protein QM564_11705, partial [Bergeyella sp.]